MGLYDTFVLRGKEVHCPYCGHELSVELDGEKICDFQTKCLDGILHAFGSSEELPRLDSGLKIVEGEIPVYTVCDNCGSGLKAYAIVSGGKFTDVRFLTPDEEREVNEETFGTSYGLHYYSYVPENKLLSSISVNLDIPNVTILYVSLSKRDADAFLIGYSRRIQEEHPTEVDIYSDFANRFHFRDETYGVIHYRGFYVVVKTKSKWNFPCPQCGGKSKVRWTKGNPPSTPYEMGLYCPNCSTTYEVFVQSKDDEIDGEDELDLME